MVQLTNCQKSALKDILKWFLSASTSPFVLEGEAGTGKTTLIQELILVLKQKTFCVPLVTAPSNEAVRQLRLAISNNEYKYQTTHSALGFRFDTTLKDKPLKQFPEHMRLDHFNLLIVDEYSFVGEILEQALAALKIKILYVGHQSQLPEVKLNLSVLDNCFPIIATKNYPKATLIENCRNTNEIYLYAKKLEKTIYEKFKFIYYHNKIGEHKVDSLLAKNKSLFLQKEAKYLTWTNKKCLEKNLFLRREIFGKNCNIFEPGDILLLTKPCSGFKRQLSEKSNSFKGEFLSNNTEVKVINIIKKKVLGLNVTQLYISCTEGKFYIYIAESDNYLQALRINHYPKVKSPKAFQQYHKILDVFASVIYSYAITVYRSQGMTINNAILDVIGISKTPNPWLRQRQLYVGASRAKENLITIGS